MVGYARSVCWDSRLTSRYCYSPLTQHLHADSAASNRSAASGVAWADSLPQELMCGTSLNPTVAALVVAIGEQLDVVDAAVHALQVRSNANIMHAYHAQRIRMKRLPA